MVRPTAPHRGRAALLALVLTGSCAAAACAPTEGPPTPATSSPAPSPPPSGTPSATPSGTPSRTQGPPLPSPSGTPSDTPTPTQSTSPSPSPAPTAPFVADTAPDRGSARGGAAGYLTDIRIGAHNGYDRVVFEYSGPGTPSWHIRYVDETIADPSGNPYLVRGEAFLEATLLGVEYPQTGAPGAYDGPFMQSIPGTQAVVEVIQVSVFEGQMQTFIGISPQPLPFRAFGLTNPSRVVVDVLHAP